MKSLFVEEKKISRINGLSGVLVFLLKYLRKNFFKDTRREKSTLKLNSNAYEKYEYGHLGRWYIKLTLCKRF